MAYTYPQTPVLSKIKIGNGVKYLKDDDVRKILDTFNNAVVTNEIGTVDGNDGKFVTAANIKAYVDQAVAVGIQIVVDTQAQDKEEPATPASATTLGKLYFVELAGTTSGTYTEFITLDKGAEANPRYVWEKIGTTDVDLSDYYTKTEIDNKLALKEDKANLKALAYKDNATGTVTYTAPTGEGSVTYDKVNATGSFTGTSATIRVTGNYEGVTAETATYGLSISTTPVLTGIDYSTNSVEVTAEGGQEGTAATVTADFLVPGSFPTLTAAQTATFATSGVVAAIDSQDSEMLVFTDASTDTAVTAQGTLSGGSLPSLDTTKFNGGTPTKLPTTYTTADVVTSINEEQFTTEDAITYVNIGKDASDSNQMTVVTGISEATLTATFTGTYTPEGSVGVTTTPTTATVTVDTTTTATTTVTVQ